MIATFRKEGLSDVLYSYYGAPKALSIHGTKKKAGLWRSGRPSHLRQLARRCLAVTSSLRKIPAACLISLLLSFHRAEPAKPDRLGASTSLPCKTGSLNL